MPNTPPDTSPNTSPQALKARLIAEARAAGFEAVGITSPHLPEHYREALQRFLAAGHHGTMEWMERNADRRGNPHVLWPEAESIIVLGHNYGPAQDPLPRLDARDRGVISVYALGEDYHDVIKAKLKALAQQWQASHGGEFKIFVDTAPVMEKPLAVEAGLGWQGKHTCVVSREYGSWLFLGEIFTTLPLPIDAPESDHCGSCTRCLDICPTQAFTAPRQLDARKCISYLTIEHKGHIAPEFRRAMGNRIYGCDDCLAICPWNKFAETARETRYHARTILQEDPPLATLLTLDDATFREWFAKSPVKRTGRDRFVRNVLIAAGNSGDTGLVPVIVPLLRDASPLVRAMAVWALAELQPAAHHTQAWITWRREHLPIESDPEVVAEWECAG